MVPVNYRPVFKSAMSSGSLLPDVYQSKRNLFSHTFSRSNGHASTIQGLPGPHVHLKHGRLPGLVILSGIRYFVHSHSVRGPGLETGCHL